MNISGFSQSSNASIQSTTLDKVYRKQLRTLRDLITRRCHNHDIDLCRRWLTCFGQASRVEKLARNCLCELLKSQLQEHGRLGQPFTEKQNLCHDLQWVVQQLDINTYRSSTAKLLNCAQQCSTPCNYVLTVQTSERDEPSIEMNIYEYAGQKYVHGASEKLDKATQAETIICQKETKLLNVDTISKENTVPLGLQHQNEDLNDSRHVELMPTCELIDLENEFVPDAELLQHNKPKLVKAIEKTLYLLEEENVKDINSLRLFERIFQNYPNRDKTLIEQFQKFDQQLQVILQKMLQKDMEEKLSIMKKFTKDRIVRKKEKLRQKYDRHLQVQSWAHQLQFKLLRLKCFSFMRKMFIDAPQKTSESLLGMLKELEEKFQCLMNEIL